MGKTILSLGNSKKVCGYEIKKMPIGAYLRAIEKIKSLPGDFISEFFPGQSLNQIVEGFANLEEPQLITVLSNVFTSAPKYVAEFIGELTGIGAENIVNDENIGIDGLIEIIRAFIEVNKLGESVLGASEIKGVIKTLLNSTLTTGSKD